MKKDSKSITCIVIAGICTIRIIMLLLDFLQFKINLTNPLIPRSIIDLHWNYTAFISVSYLVIVAFNIFYLLVKKAFLPVVVFSVIGIFAISIYGPYLDYNYNPWRN